MANLEELRAERLRKLNELIELKINPYPASGHRDSSLVDITNNFTSLEGKKLSVVGRITNIRRIGAISFIKISDMSGSIQLFLKKDNLLANINEQLLGYDQLNLLDISDFIEVRGRVIKTKTQEISLEVDSLKLLTKSLRQLPNVNEGFTNKEERLRRRYVDMNVNLEVRERFVRRSHFWQAVRDFLIKRDFLEVNIPVLEHTTGGADANPFVTHMDALNQDFYLRISHELPLKRLIGGGLEKVFDIGPRFRNENYSDEHLPEHIAMEWYWAYADWRAGLELQTEMFKEVILKTFGTHKFVINGLEVDLSVDWPEWDYAETIAKHYNNLDIFNCRLEDVAKLLKEHHLEVAKTDNLARMIDKLWKNVRSQVAGPIWLINTPKFISPLAKSNPERPEVTQRFQAVIGGSELSNGFSELNDPIDQYKRFIEQQAMRENGDKEAMMLDLDFVEMLEYGIPPTCGLGFSERVFWLFEGVSAREGVPFPQLRFDYDTSTRRIYPEVFKNDKT